MAYKPVGLLLGAAAGLVANAVFQRLWTTATGQERPPQAQEEDRGWGEVLLAAALQGALFALVKAAVDRAGAQGMRRLTGSWPN
ncbi:MAG TPA: DUF4235 domain-containing protein [Natronosporangium sp.]|nr:DUF4235 domain-containing protein [Natronosporangium sp.]